MSKRNTFGGGSGSETTLDALEPRLLFSGHQQIISLLNGTVSVRRQAGQGGVSISFHHARRHSTLTVSFNGRSRTYSAASVKHLLVSGMNRDDMLTGTPTFVTTNGSGTYNLSGSTFNGSTGSLAGISIVPTNIGVVGVPLEGNLTIDASGGSVGAFDGSGAAISVSGGAFNSKGIISNTGGYGAIIETRPPADPSVGALTIAPGSIINLSPGAVIPKKLTLVLGSAIILPDGTIIPYTPGMTLPVPCTLIGPSDPRAQAANNPPTSTPTLPVADTTPPTTAPVDAPAMPA